jgi:glyoxylase-like metal-dependent hydrolase (beta-lactamase superfamily II)
MTNFICTTCGTQFVASEAPPEHCPICEDERQYIGWSGQQWTTIEELQKAHHSVIRLEETGLHGIGMEPSFAIGQRALLLQHPEGNVLWDCIPLLDDEIIKQVNALGGISHIAVSHPHFYTSCLEWAQTFNAQLHLHSSNQQWLMRPDPKVDFWQGETLILASGITLVCCGGHFPGSTVLHWAEGANKKGTLFTGDTITVVPDRRWVSFMYSYPNLIPLGAKSVRHVVEALKPFSFDRVYGGWFDRVVLEDAKNAVIRSAERYIKAIVFEE